MATTKSIQHKNSFLQSDHYLVRSEFNRKFNTRKLNALKNLAERNQYIYRLNNFGPGLNKPNIKLGHNLVRRMKMGGRKLTK